MKSFLPFLLAVAPLAAIAQSQPALPPAFTVQGSLPGTTARRAYLSYKTDKQVVFDSAAVHYGHFQFKGTVLGSARAELILPVPGTPVTESPERLAFYVEKGTIRVVGTSHPQQATAQGTPLNNENTALTAQLRPVQEQLDALSTAYMALPATVRDTPAAADKLNQQVGPLYQQRQQVYATYLKAHPTQLYSLYVLESYVGLRPELSTYAALFGALAPSVRTSPHGQLVQQHIAQLQRVAIGALAPDFSQADPSGKQIKLSDLRGQYVLIDFWASWCLPCRAQNPELVKVYNTYKAKGFTVLGVSLDKENQRAAWLKAIEADGLAWPQVSSLTRPNPVAKAYGVNSIPQNFLLDPQGRIIAVNVFGEQLTQLLDKVN